MIQKKICMLGTSGVGKTSLVSRFVYSSFGDKYLTTVGVKISKKLVVAGNTDVTLMLWDIYGDDEFQHLRLSYLRGMSGYLLVADGTRAVTLDKAVDIQQRVDSEFASVPFVFALNKADLQPLWEIEQDRIDPLTGKGWTVIKTSAKAGSEVEEAFRLLTERMMRPK